MTYKNIEHNFSFADIVVQRYIDKNRSILFLRQVNNSIDWQPIQDLLLKYCSIGKSKEGERAYPPLFLFKCFLLQKWFQIKSDPELESQINDRLSFKSSWIFLWKSRLLITLLFPGSAAGFPKKA